MGRDTQGRVPEAVWLLPGFPRPLTRGRWPPRREDAQAAAWRGRGGQALRPRASSQAGPPAPARPSDRGGPTDLSRETLTRNRLIRPLPAPDAAAARGGVSRWLPDAPFRGRLFLGKRKPTCEVGTALFPLPAGRPGPGDSTSSLRSLLCRTGSPNSPERRAGTVGRAGRAPRPVPGLRGGLDATHVVAATPAGWPLASRLRGRQPARRGAFPRASCARRTRTRTRTGPVPRGTPRALCHCPGTQERSERFFYFFD